MQADINRKARRQRQPKVDTNAVLREFRETNFSLLKGELIEVATDARS
jgi:hypothetical protein